MEEENIICKLCGKECLYLGSHLWFKHKMKARAYKEMFSLDYNYPLISAEVKEKKRLAFEERREYYLKNLLKSGKKYHFKKGHAQTNRVSKQTRKRLVKQVQNVKKQSKGICLICKVGYQHLQSHLYNAHGLISVIHLT